MNIPIDTKGQTMHMSAILNRKNPRLRNKITLSIAGLATALAATLSLAAAPAFASTSVTLATSNFALSGGQYATLTAHATSLPMFSYLAIYDTTSSLEIASCPVRATTCSADVTNLAGTFSYVAHVMRGYQTDASPYIGTSGTVQVTWYYNGR